jgi:hypothetical protein
VVVRFRQNRRIPRQGFVRPEFLRREIARGAGNPGSITFAQLSRLRTQDASVEALSSAGLQMNPMSVCFSPRHARKEARMFS